MTTSRSGLRVFIAHLAYGICVHLACLVAIPPLIVRMLRDRRQVGWILRRLGRLPEGRPAGKPIWIHAVSVGEVKASRPLVAALREQHPDVPLVLSTGTVTGYETARGLYPELYVFPVPLDLPWVVAGVLRRIEPRLLLLLELEVWPAFMRAADRLDVPQVILNGRVSESSFRGYKRLNWWLPEFDRIDLVAAQDALYAERITALGVPAERVHVTGNLKHDLIGVSTSDRIEGLGGPLGLRDGRPVFVAGSTHEGEDEPVVQAWLAAGAADAGHLVLVPRHLDRLKDIGRLLRRLEVPFALRSEAGAGDPRGPETVLLVDTMGELEDFFALADVVFLGGSLTPVGGHNVLEPAAAGRPVLVGPFLETCRREADILEAAGGLAIVADGAALGSTLGQLLTDESARRTMGDAARDAVRGLQGATAADLALLRDKGFLPGSALESRDESATLGSLVGSQPATSESHSGARIR